GVLGEAAEELVVPRALCADRQGHALLGSDHETDEPLDLERSLDVPHETSVEQRDLERQVRGGQGPAQLGGFEPIARGWMVVGAGATPSVPDRKSTRLNS